MSTMHYFEFQEKMLKKFSDVLKEKGTFFCGDLTIHELDDQGFFETLERTLSRAHTRYCKPSEIQKLMQTSGFRISKIKTIAYRKSYDSLMEDKEHISTLPLKCFKNMCEQLPVRKKRNMG